MKTWICTATATTTAPNGRTAKMHRTFDGSGDLKKAALESIAKRQDGGAMFIGCEILLETPLHYGDLSGVKVILSSNYDGLYFEDA